MRAVADHIRAARAELAGELEAMAVSDRRLAVWDACIETGGSFVPANICKGAAHFAELNLLGVYHSGNDAAEAIANWIKAVHRLESEAA